MIHHALKFGSQWALTLIDCGDLDRFPLGEEIPGGGIEGLDAGRRYRVVGAARDTGVVYVEVVPTFVTKTSGDPSARIVMEYLCPIHGRFESIEPRATAPESRPCPSTGTDECEICGAMPDEEHGRGCYADSSDLIVCGATSPWSPSAPKAHMPVSTVVRGTSDERPPNALDTRPLADGMSMSEWTKLNRKKNRELVRAKMRKEFL